MDSNVSYFDIYWKNFQTLSCPEVSETLLFDKIGSMPILVRAAAMQDIPVMSFDLKDFVTHPPW